MSSRKYQFNRFFFNAGIDIYGMFLYIPLSIRSGQHQKKRYTYKQYALLFNDENKNKVYFHNIKKRFLLFKNFYCYLNNVSLYKNKEFSFNKVELRLDVVLVRTNLVSSFFEARQLISHGKICINNRVILQKSYLLIPGDFVFILDKYYLAFLKKRSNLFLSDITMYINCPAYIEVDYIYLQLIVLYLPSIYEIPIPTFTLRNIIL